MSGLRRGLDRRTGAMAAARRTGRRPGCRGRTRPRESTPPSSPRFTACPSCLDARRRMNRRAITGEQRVERLQLRLHLLWKRGDCGAHAHLHAVGSLRLQPRGRSAAAALRFAEHDGRCVSSAPEEPRGRAVREPARRQRDRHCPTSADARVHGLLACAPRASSSSTFGQGF